MLRNSIAGYGRIAIAFHWTMAALILGMLGLGLYMSDLPPADPETFKLYQLHKSFGLTALALASLRLLWRLANATPALPAAMPRWERLGAHLGHFGLYALMFAIPLSGWAMVSASPWNIPTVLFDTLHVPHLPIPEALGAKAAVETFFKQMHELFAFALIGLLIVHVAAALKHHLLSRDDTLRRMVTSRFARGA